PPATNPNPTAQQEPSFTLTNEEAITRFEELDAMRLQAYRDRDPTLLSLAFGSGSRIAGQITDEIAELRNSNVLDRTRFRTVSIDVVDRKNGEITLRQRVVIEPRFATESGEDVTSQQHPVRQVITWVMREENGEWLLFDAAIESSKILD
ncbi:MAG: hypothetical protein ACRDI3_00470, partial [Actinomycetota bacterium]